MSIDEDCPLFDGLREEWIARGKAEGKARGY